MTSSGSASRSPDGVPPAGLTLAVERLWPRLAARYHRPGVAESFPGPRSMEDLPLYRMARRLLRAGLARRGREFPIRAAEQPSDVASGLEHKAPQFFLRSVGRVERAEEERLPLAPTAGVARVDLSAVRAQAGRYRPPALLQRFNVDEVAWLRGLIRRVVFQEDWRRRFGRELKQRVRGPLFRYDPDAPPPEA
ncbi:MAG TPA: hypothetical protein PK313_12705 [Myxococcota bacterium]|nr:hypothetical protein [Myxococcota bacterium]